MASGLAKVEIMRKNIMRKKRMSAKAPVSTSDCSLERFLIFIFLGEREKRWKGERATGLIYII
jgi:hypothetical protein